MINEKFEKEFERQLKEAREFFGGDFTAGVNSCAKDLRDQFQRQIDSWESSDVDLVLETLKTNCLRTLNEKGSGQFADAYCHFSLSVIRAIYRSGLVDNDYMRLKVGMSGQAIFNLQQKAMDY